MVSTTTLPEEKKNSDIYLTVTGENCSMWDFKDQLEYEAVEEAAITPVQLTKYYTEAKTGDIPNLDCFGWWTTHSVSPLIPLVTSRRKRTGTLH